MLSPLLCGKEVSTGVEITGGPVVVVVVVRVGVSIGIGGGVTLAVEVTEGVGVGRTVGVARGGGVVLTGVLDANDVRGWVRGGLLTGGFLTVIEEATVCPATSVGCVEEGCLGVTRRLRPVLRRVGGGVVVTLFLAVSVGVGFVTGGGLMRRACGTAGLVPSMPDVVELVVPVATCAGCLVVGGLMLGVFLARRGRGVGVGVAEGILVAVGLPELVFVSIALATVGVLLPLAGVVGREPISARAVSNSPS
jgi:hypothetical protein